MVTSRTMEEVKTHETGASHSMADVTQILSAIQQGESSASAELLTAAYNELRSLAALKLREERPGQTLQATALVHEAWLRLISPGVTPTWENRQHFLGAAAEAMRRILVEIARRKGRLKHGGSRRRIELNDAAAATSDVAHAEVLDVHEAVDQLEHEDAQAADLVKLHYFAGLSIEEAAECLGIPRASAYRLWTFAKARLRLLIGDSSD